MTLRQLIHALVTAFGELVRLVLELVSYIWNLLLDLPAIYYVFAVLALLAIRPTLYFGEQCADALRAVHGRPKLESVEHDWGYRFGLRLKQYLERVSEAPPEGE